MSSSSPTDDHLKREMQAVALGELAEADEVSAQHPRDVEKALGADLSVALAPLDSWAKSWANHYPV